MTRKEEIQMVVHIGHILNELSVDALDSVSELVQDAKLHRQQAARDALRAIAERRDRLDVTV